jgi:4-amino-4-deoxy-L-arabinose transferase-like glycosyltransferase
MSLESDHKHQLPRRKSLWPWLLLLILTLLAIYSWNRATELWDDFSRNMPTAIIELFNGLLNEHRRDERTGPKLDVMVPVLFSVK